MPVGPQVTKQANKTKTASSLVIDWKRKPVRVSKVAKRRQKKEKEKM